MAKSLLQNVFRIAKSSLNFLSPSIIADILLHPFDFATVLLQIGFDPEGVKYETATLVSVILQYALFTFYIPYLLTSMQGLQFMGMPHPSIFYYVNFIYTKEGLAGCYRGLMPKIFERMIMLSVNDRFKRKFEKDADQITSTNVNHDSDADKFIRTLINSLCSQFFAVLASHPFHVLMITSFAEFTYDKRSSIFELFRSIYVDDGYFGFFTGLSARLFGELLSLIFSLTYTNIINKQLARPQEPPEDPPEALPHPRTASTLVNYVTDASRFNVFKPSKSEEEANVDYSSEEEDSETEERGALARSAEWFNVFMNFLRNLTHNSSRRRQPETEVERPRRVNPILAYLPITSKLFYYIMIRDFLSKKISYPFFLVCHSLIVFGGGWDRFPLRKYMFPLAKFVQRQIKEKKRKKPFTNRNAR